MIDRWTSRLSKSFYQATASALRTYLYRVCRERRVVDDLVQEAYFRLLRSKFASQDPEEVVRYLFRIATNLLKGSLGGGSERTG